MRDTPWQQTNPTCRPARGTITAFRKLQAKQVRAEEEEQEREAKAWTDYLRSDLQELYDTYYFE